MRGFLPCLVLLAACSAAEVPDHPEKRQPIPEDERPPLYDDTGAPDDGGDDAGGSGSGEGGSGEGGSGDSGSGDSGSGDGGGGVPQSEACHPDVEDWPEAWAELEEEVVTEINERRAKGASCGSYGSYGKADPVAMDADLRCAARYHSLWMAENNTFDHDSPGGDLGDDPWERIDATDFGGTAVGENIAAGYFSARDVVDGWVDSDGHCANLMNPSATLTGVGFAEGGAYGSYWTQNFGR